MQMRFSASEQSETWERFEAGESMRSIARSIGRSQAAVRGLIQKTGGIRPLAPTVWSDARMSLVEREEISRGLASGLSMRQVAAGLGRARPGSLDGLPRGVRQRRPTSLPGV
jgi:IS30 family transposase